MFKSSNLDLPMATHSSSTPDGSGRAVKMDAPIVRAWKNSSGYTKATYYWLVTSVLVMWWGWRHIRYNHASIWLNCRSASCTLHITPPRQEKGISVEILRSQLIRTENVKVSPGGMVVETVTGFAPEPRKGGKKKKTQNSKGPDAYGNYNSYMVVFREGGDVTNDASNMMRDEMAKLREIEESSPGAGGTNNEAKTTHDLSSREMAEMAMKEEMLNHMDEPMAAREGGGKIPETVTFNKKAMEKDEDEDDVDIPPGNLEPLKQWVKPNHNGEYQLVMRMFDLGQTPRRCRTMVSKINSYIRNRRHKFTAKENKTVTWQGILAMISGLFSLLLSILLGQFWEPETHNRYGGPGARRKMGGGTSSSGGSAASRQARPGARGGGTTVRRTAGRGEYDSKRNY